MRIYLETIAAKHAAIERALQRLDDAVELNRDQHNEGKQQLAELGVKI